MSLDEALQALTDPAPGASGPATVRRPPVAAPRGWEPGVKYDPAGAMLVTSEPSQHLGDETAWRCKVEDLGLQIPDGWRVRLVEAKYDPAAWHRDREGEDAVTRPVWRYRFAVEPDVHAQLRDDADSIVRDVMRRRRPPRQAPGQVSRALVAVYADPQTGKVASQGGTRELAERVAAKYDLLEDHVRDLRKVGRPVDAAYWLDAGDCIEGFENTASQAFTNDLTLTQQVRVARRLAFHGIDRLAALFPRVVAATCGSNHARVRRGKDAVGPAHDDWGIEILAQVADAYSRNPDAYGHVSFVLPEPHTETVALDIAGTVVGLAHGHQVNRPERIVDWWKGQAFGRQAVADAQVLITGHFHHWRAQQVGDGRLWLQAPTLDNGSDWFASLSGEVSRPGMLVFTVGPDGWDDLRIL